MTGSLIISMPIGQTNDEGVSMPRRTNIVDIYSKAKGCFTIYDTVAGCAFVSQVVRAIRKVRRANQERISFGSAVIGFSVKREASESKNERRSALP
jgi:hypothetical protein